MKVKTDSFRWLNDSDGGWLCIKCNQPQRILDETEPGKTYDVEIKEHRERRSLSANNFSWTLTDKLSDVMVIRGLKLSKEEMHAEMIFRYGQLLKDDDGQNVVISTAQGIPVTEFYPYAFPFAESENNGKTFTHYRVYRGSHTYDSKEMSIFIAGIVEECKEQGIETMAPEEIARLEGMA